MQDRSLSKPFGAHKIMSESQIFDIQVHTAFELGFLCFNCECTRFFPMGIKSFNLLLFVYFWSPYLKLLTVRNVGYFKGNEDS